MTKSFVIRVTLPSLSIHAIVICFLIIALAISVSINLGVKIPLGHRPITEPLVAYLVWNSEKDAFAVAPLKSDATVASKLHDLNCQWEWIEANESRAASLLNGHLTPALVVQRLPKHEPILNEPAPATGSEVVAKIKALRND